jgi:hypothetical protein
MPPYKTELEFLGSEVNLSPASKAMRIVETGLAVADLHSAIPFVGLTKESRPGV